MSAALFDFVARQLERPLTLIDVGGHGGALENWRQFGDRARIFCFEARQDEADSLSEANSDMTIEYVSLGLSDDGRPIDIHVAAAAGCSSAYPPVERLHTRYPGCAIMRPIEQVTCPTTTLDDFLASRGVEAVHGMKLDTQGFELRVLQGGTKALEHCQFILCEAEFNPMYEGQPLFGDVDRFLRERGFVLWRLGNLAHYSTEPLAGEPHRMMVGSDPGQQQVIDVSNGQLFWSDAFYVRRDATAISDASLTREQALAGAALVSQWNFDDLALEMLRKSNDAVLLAGGRAAIGRTFVDTAPGFIPAADFQSLHLDRTGDAWRTDFSVTDACIVYGPYIRLPQGWFEATFHIAVEGLGNDLAGSIYFDVAAEMVTLTSVDLVGLAGAERLKSGRVTLQFYSGSPNARFEFRISTSGKPFHGELRFEGLGLERLAERH